MNEIEHLFLSRAIQRNGILLFSRQDALDVLVAYRKLNFRLLGVDAFVLFGEYIRPVLDNSRDYSKIKYSQDFYESAMKLVGDSDNSFYFEIIVDD